MYQLRTQLEAKKKGKSLKNQNTNGVDQPKNSTSPELRNDKANDGAAMIPTKDIDISKRMMLKNEEPAAKPGSAGNFFRQLHFPSLGGTPPPSKLGSSKYYMANSEITRKYNHSGLRNSPGPSDASMARHYNSRTCIRSPLLVPASKQSDARNSMMPSTSKLPAIDRRAQTPFVEYEPNKPKPSSGYSIKSSVPMLNSGSFASDAYRLKVRDNICRNRSFKGMNATGAMVDKGNMGMFKREHQHQHQRNSSPKNRPTSYEQFQSGSEQTATTTACRSTAKVVDTDVGLYHVYKMSSDGKFINSLSIPINIKKYAPSP